MNVMIHRSILIDRKSILHTSLGLVPLMLVLVGCQGTPPQISTEPVSAQQYRPLYRSAIGTLRDFGFEIERQDYRHGVITTDPLDSPTIFEPWKTTASTPSQAMAGTFNHLRRQVTVTLKPREASAAPEKQTASNNLSPNPSPTQSSTQLPTKAYRIRVEVLIQRREVPVRRMAGGSSTRLYANLSSVPAELDRRGISGSYWEPLARDPRLEQRLLRQIVVRAKSN